MTQTFTGTIVNLKNLKTAAVEITSAHLHPKYHVPYKRNKKIWAHYEQIELQLGDEVKIKSSRPLSKTKRFKVIEKLRSKIIKKETN